MIRRAHKSISRIKKPTTDQPPPKEDNPERAASEKDNTDEAEELYGIRKHRRYLSKFSSNLVKIDITHHQELEKKVYLEIDIGAQLVACVGPNSLYKEPRLLTDFPGFSEAAKIAINNFLERNDKGAVRVGVGECWRSTLRIFAWMTRRNIFNLSDLNREIIDELMMEVSLNGWAVVLRQDELLRDFIEEAKKNQSLLSRISKRDRKGAYYSFPVLIFESSTGLPLNMWAISDDIYEELAPLEGDKRKVNRTEKIVNSQADAVRSLAWTLNALSLTTPNSIKFRPFRSVASAVKKFINQSQRFSKAKFRRSNSTKNLVKPLRSPQPTINLTVDECLKIFSESARWIYDYSSVILETVSRARQRLECIPAWDRNRQATAWSDISAEYCEMASSARLPITNLNHKSTRSNSLRHLVKMLQEACQDMLGLCSARRPNEIIGKNRVPYGLYLGALIKLNETPPIYCLDFYVSKGPQKWFHFPANQLMVDAYQVLEKLYQLHEPFSKKKDLNSSELSEIRKQKMFTLRNMTTSCLSEGRRTHSDLPRKDFLKLCGVDPARFEKTMTPFRRIFCVLHMFRYDMSEEAALQHYLGQVNQSTTQGYFRDNFERPFGEYIRELHSPDFIDSELLQEIELSKIEYTSSQILLMLNGDEISGGFPVIVCKLAKKLSSNIDFVKLSNELKADRLANDLYKNGYRANPYEHTSCMGSASKKSNETANCFRDGMLHKEDASPGICCGCVNALTNAIAMKRLKNEQQQSAKAANNPNLPKALATAHSRRAIELSSIIAKEESIAQKNSNLFLKVENEWVKMISPHIKSLSTK